MTHSIFVLAMLFSGALSDSGESPYSARYAQCLDDSDGVTVAMHDCMAAELGIQDARLNRTYRELIDVLSPQRKRQLTASQRTWLKYRDENCAFYADPDGGSAASLSAHGCVLRETAERASELENMKAP